MAVALLIALTLPHLPRVEYVPRVHRPRAVHQRVAGWGLHVVSDPFTGKAVCRLRGKDMEYAGGVVTLRFSERLDTSHALYRVDYGYVRPWTAARIDLIRLGAPLQVDDPSNPSGGRLPLPASYLQGATTVLVKPTARNKYKLFKVSGLPAALAAAQKAGCDPMTSFPR